jgi:hypothetical protein
MYGATRNENENAQWLEHDTDEEGAKLDEEAIRKGID